MTGASGVPGGASRCEWHVLVDSFEKRNASAILNIARNLQNAAGTVGVPSYLAVGREQADGHVDREGVLLLGHQGYARRAADLLSKSMRGRPVAARTDFAGHRSQPTHIYLHNQPWFAHAFRREFPDAALYLYAHNVLLRRVPRRAIRALSSQLDGVIGVSRFIVDDLAVRCGIERSRLHVVHSGVNADAFAAAGRAATDVDVLFLGRMVSEKGVDVLLHALAAAARGGTRITARIGGAATFQGSPTESAYERRLRSIAARAGLDVEFCGYVDPQDVPGLMNAARLVVVPSVWPEPLGLVALEALASDAALVCSRSGGMPEIVGDGGLVVPPRDAAALSDAMAALLRDEPRRLRLADRGRTLARDRTWARAYRRLQLIDSTHEEVT